jgi:hypothetical protein
VRLVPLERDDQLLKSLELLPDLVLHALEGGQ